MVGFTLGTKQFENYQLMDDTIMDDPIKESTRGYQNKMIQKLIRRELDFANQKFPPFTSSMEGLGVIQEEYDESMEEIEQLDWMFLLFKQELRTKTPNVQYHSCELKKSIESTILELIQMSAMIEKFQNIK